MAMAKFLVQTNIFCLFIGTRPTCWHRLNFYAYYGSLRYDGNYCSYAIRCSLCLDRYTHLVGVNQAHKSLVIFDKDGSGDTQFN